MAPLMMNQPAWSNLTAQTPMQNFYFPYNPVLLSNEHPLPSQSYFYPNQSFMTPEQQQYNPQQQTMQNMYVPSTVAFSMPGRYHSQ
jgi:hypothetical protein